MQRMGFLRTMALAGVGLVFAGLAVADRSIEVKSGWVVPVRFDSDLSIKSRQGQRVYAIVEDSRDLPKGSQLEGEVVRVQPERDGRPGLVDVRFQTIWFPDGSRHKIDAVPVSLRSDRITKDRDGRMVFKQSKPKSERTVFGAILGGALLGSLIDKPFEGAFLGTLAGILIAEGERSASEVLVRKGDAYGMLFQRDFKAKFDDRYDPRDNRYDPRGNRNDPRGDRYDPRDDRYDPRGDRYDPRGDQYDPRGDRYDPRNGGERTPIQLLIDNRAVSFPQGQQAYDDRGAIMVPIQPLQKQLGFSVQWVRDSRRAYIETDDAILVVEQDQADCRLNGKRERMARPAVFRDDVIYVPLETLKGLTDRNLRIEGTFTKQ
ncbi:MAG: hypothetical protein L6Q31_02550 [Fimbriimonadaceae bacterium]|uniref:Copper amine oxidase-like N-terminal domain-containing protein n=1 Tax=Candidatus Nitrosymbiomonas proteolyticus TaxID=2608984 RepID=A0A809RSH6_9BACT|nr:hypothetical protein [Fimbriimonadaceae bacterium]BBO22662.1 conserved hypothetical protein [Candidatus Nitrosymbiomonas proteolyticus]